MFFPGFYVYFLFHQKKALRKLKNASYFNQTNFSFTKHSIFCNLPGLCLMRGGRISVANKLVIPTPNRKSPPKIFIPPSPKIPPVNNRCHVITQYKLQFQQQSLLLYHFSLTSCFMHINVMLILNLIDVQYLWNFCFQHFEMFE